MSFLSRLADLARLITRNLRSDVQYAGAALVHAWQTRADLHRNTKIVLGVLAAAFGISATAAISLAPMIADRPLPAAHTIMFDIAPENLAEQAQLLDSATVPIHSFVRQPANTSQNLNGLLNSLGVDDDEAAQYLHKSNLAQLLFARSTRNVSAETADDGTLKSLHMLSIDASEKTQGSSIPDYSATESLLTRDEKSATGFTLTQRPIALNKQVRIAKGVIRSTLFAAADDAEIPDSVTVQLVEIFDGEIDFRTDLRKGDNFQITYEILSVDGEPLRSARLLSAQFINKGQTFEALWFKPSDGSAAGYYAFNGKSLRQAFLRTPLEFSRVSSGFGTREHPISHRWKQHKGVDFAAASGTAVRAASDGVVKMAGKGAGKGYTGYGNVIELEHRNGITTLYAHLSGFASGVHNGVRMKQGDVIGYVGTSGWSTGPHLHYEFRVKGEHVNPLTVALPEAGPLSNQDLESFALLRTDTLHQLALASELKIAKAR